MFGFNKLPLPYEPINVNKMEYPGITDEFKGEVYATKLENYLAHDKVIEDRRSREAAFLCNKIVNIINVFSRKDYVNKKYTIKGSRWSNKLKYYHQRCVPGEDCISKTVVVLNGEDVTKFIDKYYYVSKLFNSYELVKKEL